MLKESLCKPEDADHICSECCEHEELECGHCNECGTYVEGWADRAFQEDMER